MTRLVVCAALRIEAWAARGAGWTTVRVGMGPARASSAELPDFHALAMVGVAGGLGHQVSPGDLFVATEVRSDGRRIPCPAAAPLFSLLDEGGLPVRSGPLVTLEHVVRNRRERSRLAEDGALAVDMESAPLARAAADRPFAVLRAIVDTPDRPLIRPGTPYRGLLALRRLRQAVPFLLPWAENAAGPISGCRRR